ncbi:3,4-dihydroxy-2-butanone-4-phosphate synthase [Natrarchaeobius chitinivorans]|uniref:3,4-dihydroxy-2-butanone 4-phosphate synthase n=1 Tax=Natrarchaeobius chitinivorans TaxID=1679083 RepID=A0A3N6MLX4_NATCH|nr:3,4-dihydroxy-2-butanone-4-phosphate synthase [Natrarchaeobius chitinivorans]RQG95406.1 3,4-dihydroxy-2-butanone-4-phosphate synthase [Natrarchaeobius chitinivorans]
MSSEIESAYRRRTVKRALEAFRSGKPVLIHDFDDREGETDLVYPAAAVTSQHVSRLRNDAGGLICVALAYEIAEAFELPFLSEEISHPVSETGHLGYDDRSSFSLPVNHRDTRTGITDHDRALTISELGRAATDPDSIDFASTFRSPGHVHLLKAADGLLSRRQGHTELGIALANAAGREPAVVVCEMVDDETGAARSRESAIQYANEHGFPFVDGTTLINDLP